MNKFLAMLFAGILASAFVVGCKSDTAPADSGDAGKPADTNTTMTGDAGGAAPAAGDAGGAAPATGDAGTTAPAAGDTGAAPAAAGAEGAGSGETKTGG